MDWLDRNLQREILKELNNIYPDSKTYEYWIDAAIAQVAGVIETVGEAELYIATPSNTIIDNHVANKPKTIPSAPHISDFSGRRPLRKSAIQTKAIPRLKTNTAPK